MDAKEVVLGFHKAAAKKDRAAVKNFLAPDVVWEDNGPPEMKGGGKFHGADEVLDYIWGNIRDTRDLVITPHWMVSEEDRVVLLINEHAVIGETGRYYEINSIHVYTLKDSVIVQFINYFDSMPMLKALYDIQFNPPQT